MDILLSNGSGIPIYQQIITQIRRMILTGELKPNDALPSMRQLAKDLRISLITTKRAYEELEAMGLLVTAAGKGCFVGAANPEQLQEQHRLQTEEQLQKAVAIAKAGGISEEQFLTMAKLLFHDEESE
ncbi:MAG: GntR family transcriptional regulator [Angelakisella sp.]